MSARLIVLSFARAASRPIVARWAWWARAVELGELAEDEHGLFPGLRGSA